MKHIRPYRIFEGDGGGEGLSFDQLSPGAKQRAISNYEPYTEGWSGDAINNFVEDMMDYGVDVDAKTVEWDDSFDVWFKGKVWFVDNLNFINAIGMKEEVAKSENKFIRAEGDAYPEFWKDLYITINHSMGRNPYSKAMFITIEDIDDEQISQELVDEIEEKGNEWIREKAAELGKQLDSEWDHMNSEESAQDYYENMDTRFNSDGTEI
jgi:hypothetical protein